MQANLLDDAHLVLACAPNVRKKGVEFSWVVFHELHHLDLLLVMIAEAACFCIPNRMLHSCTLDAELDEKKHKREADGSDSASDHDECQCALVDYIELTLLR